jgi:hypothetical protein
MIGVPGGCVICDKAIFSSGRPNENFTQVEVTWSNKSVMPIGVCMDCAGTHKQATDEGKRAIEKWHWTFWDAQRARYDKEITLV